MRVLVIMCAQALQCVGVFLRGRFYAYRLYPYPSPGFAEKRDEDAVIDFLRTLKFKLNA